MLLDIEDEGKIRKSSWNDLVETAESYGVGTLTLKDVPGYRDFSITMDKTRDEAFEIFQHYHITGEDHRHDERPNRSNKHKHHHRYEDPDLIGSAEDPTTFGTSMLPHESLLSTMQRCVVRVAFECDDANHEHAHCGTGLLSGRDLLTARHVWLPKAPLVRGEPFLCSRLTRCRIYNAVTKTSYLDTDDFRSIPVAIFGKRDAVVVHLGSRLPQSFPDLT